MIVSNNAANAALNRVIMVPLSSTTTKVYPGEALVTQIANREKRCPIS
jgi:mRNA-degrading endonuclease toxin of MazEF toxin-antitoxin module